MLWDITKFGCWCSFLGYPLSTAAISSEIPITPCELLFCIYISDLIYFKELHLRFHQKRVCSRAIFLVIFFAKEIQKEMLIWRVPADAIRQMISNRITNIERRMQHATHFIVHKIKYMMAYDIDCRVKSLTSVRFRYGIARKSLGDKYPNSKNKGDKAHKLAI
jgi:hypothetical protein